ncbi:MULTISPECIES: c-type cytochrome biogenesis protein CcsB [Corynebacterium]|uniref:c-type cytochrome biogenesis protein CcsB n=1 Tax=Corynebacterium TaxID=1716 RepID=UPI0008A35A17|nr:MULTISPECIES: c-type cytochrome biogenesis protein CcsB [Corynebacterium]MTD97617.1 c-type cytochrome biogenesis protein CcsB [Corynebacterium guaraldiae]OFP86437.1 c-type cytochrome biogenesis protein CcsB [Corynebacterium sp. HMSC059E07]TRX52139.1 c-type cytochrome biogenesis protein CcsB [Corynebacterium guaraldiae]
MQVDQNLSNFSDIAVQTAFVVYALALVLSLVYYGRMQSIIEAMRVRTAAAPQQRELATVGASADGAVLGDVPPVSSTADDDLAKKQENADKLGGMTQMLLWLGIALHLAAIVLRGLATGRFPFGNLYEYMLMVTAGAMVVATIAMQRKEWRTLWPWLLTPILALMFYGSTKLYAESAPVVPALQSHWLPIHVTVVSLGASIGVVSGIASLLSVLREFQPKGVESGFFGALARPLPSAKKLDRLAYRLGVVALPTLGLGIVLGAIWAESAWGRYWGWDPKETVSFATWILYAAYLHARATPAFRKAAPYINIAAMLLMVFNLFFINMVVSGLHSYAGLN